MKVLITGGAGFLGLHLATFLKKKGFQLTLDDIHSFDSEEYQGDLNLVLIDVRDKKKIDQFIKGHDVVVHCAAALPLWKKEDIYSTNIDGTRNILASALKHGVKRVIHISSTAVYGIPKKHPIEENDPLQGVGPYGESKIAAEALCREYMKKGLNVTIIRPKTFVGTARLGVFEILFDWIHDNKKIPVFGSGNNLYQLLDVDDLVEAIYLFIERGKGKEIRGKGFNDTFNIGAEKYSTVKKDLTELFIAARSKSRVLPIPSVPLKFVLRMFEFLHISPLYKWVYETADKDSYVSIEKIKNVLGWKPKYSNAQALIKAYKWYLEHYKDIKSHSSGVTHTVGWKQGILGIVKKLM